MCLWSYLSSVRKKTGVIRNVKQPSNILPANIFFLGCRRIVILPPLCERQSDLQLLQ
jgi:hypothetical protein